MTVRYTRTLRRGDKGSDVEGVGRALSRSNTKGATRFSAFVLLPQGVRRTFGPRKVKDLTLFKKKHGLKPDGIYTEQAHRKLSPYFDAKARRLMRDWHPPLSEAERHWARLYEAMQAVDKATTGYDYGGGHGVPLDSLHPWTAFDCSSSTSWVLHKAGLFPREYAITSGEFTRDWGVPGPGELFTVYANYEHVWVRLHRSLYWRFDTSPHGDWRSNRRGARLRYLPRLSTSFTARHWPGMVISTGVLLAAFFS